jgi:hypothetical protein
MGREPILKAGCAKVRRDKAGGGRAGWNQSAGQVPESALFLRRAGANRYGARAFSTLEGYAGRNRETELALSAKAEKRPATVPVFV